MPIQPVQQTPETQQIEAVLRQAYPRGQVDAYRQNVASIRVRVIDEAFGGKTLADREDEVVRLLEKKLPEELIGDILFLLLLTPGEAPNSFMNVEFEDPVPSTL